MFKHSSNAWTIAFFGILITLIIGVNPRDGGKGMIILGFLITGALVLLCLNGGSTSLPTYSKMKGDGTLWWYENSKNWTQKINGIEMTYDQYLDIFKDDYWSKSIIDYEKSKESLDREHNYYYDTFPEEEKVHWNQKNLYGRFWKIHKTPNGLYRDDYGTYRPIGHVQSDGSDIGRKYVNGEVKMRKRGYLKPEYENNPLFFCNNIKELEEQRKEMREREKRLNEFFGKH